MTDIHDKDTRSFNMSRIKGKDTKPEIITRKHLHSTGFRYKLHDKLLPGKPDIVLPKYKTVIQVHGCFWHGHQGCDYFILPKTRQDWWKEKINKTRERDKNNNEELLRLGYRVFIIYECQLKPGKREKTLERMVKLLRTHPSETFFEINLI